MKIAYCPICHFQYPVIGNYNGTECSQIGCKGRIVIKEIK